MNALLFSFPCVRLLCGLNSSRLLYLSLLKQICLFHPIGGLVGNVGNMSARHIGVMLCCLISRRHSNVANIVTGIVGESHVGNGYVAYIRMLRTTRRCRVMSPTCHVRNDKCWQHVFKDMLRHCRHVFVTPTSLE